MLLHYCCNLWFEDFAALQFKRDDSGNPVGLFGVFDGAHQLSRNPFGSHIQTEVNPFGSQLQTEVNPSVSKDKRRVTCTHLMSDRQIR